MSEDAWGLIADMAGKHVHVVKPDGTGGALCGYRYHPAAKVGQFAIVGVGSMSGNVCGACRKEAAKRVG